MTLATTTPTPTASLRPQPGEYTPYYDRYISLVPANDVLAALEDQRRTSGAKTNCTPVKTPCLVEIQLSY